MKTAVKPKPDCRTCGVCCVSLHDQEVFCDLVPGDFKLLGQSWVRRNVLMTSSFDILVAALDGARVVEGAIKTKWRKMRSGLLRGATACCCAALRGSLLHRVSCSIYPRRPRACRVALNPGERQCLTLRRMYAELRS